MAKNSTIHYCRIFAAVVLLWLAMSYIGSIYLKYAFFILLLLVMEVNLTGEINKRLSFKKGVVSVGLFIVVTVLISRVFPTSGTNVDLSLMGIISAIVLAPVCEEVFFRKAINEGVNDIIGAIASSVIFGAFHGREMFIPATLSGLALYLIYRLTGSLKASIIAHSVNNTLAILFNPATIEFFRNLIGK